MTEKMGYYRDTQDSQPTQNSTRGEVPDRSTVQQRIKILTQLKTGYSILNEYRKKMGISKTNQCECGEV